MTFDEWAAERFTPTDVLALSAVGTAVLVGTIALAQDIEIVPDTEPIGLLFTGTLFLVGFGGLIAYLNHKNKEHFYGSVLDIEFDETEGMVVINDAVAIQIRAYPDGPIGTEVTDFSQEPVGGGAMGWYSGEEDDLYFEISLVEVA